MPLDPPDPAAAGRGRALGRGRRGRGHGQRLHGRSTVSKVGPPGGLVTSRVPSTDAARRASPARPVPRSGSAPPTAVVADDDVQPVPGALHDDFGLARLGVLGDVGQALGDHEVGDRLDHGRGPAGQVHGKPDRDRHPGRHPGQRGVQPAVLQHGRVQAADQVAQFRQRGLGLLVRLGDGLPGAFSRRRLHPGHAQVDRQRHQPLLGAVVQVALQAAPLGVGGVDHPGPGLREPLDAVLQLLSAAGAQQRPRDEGVQRGHAGGQPRRRRQHPDPGQGQGKAGRQPVGVVQGDIRGQPFRVERGQRADDAAYPRADRGDRGHCQRGRGQQVICQLPPGRLGAGGGGDAMRGEPAGHPRLARDVDPGGGPQPVPLHPGQRRKQQE